MSDGYDEVHALRLIAEGMERERDAAMRELEETRRELAKLREEPPRPLVVLSMKMDPDLPPNTVECRHPSGRIDRFLLTVDGPRLQVGAVFTDKAPFLVDKGPSNDD
jgi:hypothetical protein